MVHAIPIRRQLAAMLEPGAAAAGASRFGDALASVTI